ncbi:MAG: hypothetical protein DRO52_01100 [Candidatus Hecatellales archaeon]|nr:MAG: hypothetical protein DRO52_01100 [Candidatus Hecatellales archaeon]
MPRKKGKPAVDQAQTDIREAFVKILPKEKREEAEKALKDLGKGVKFGGYKATLVYRSCKGDFSVTMPIRHEMLKVPDVKIQTVKRTLDGGEVRVERIRGTTKYYDAKTGRELSPKEVVDYQVFPDGRISDKPIKAETTRVFEVKLHRPREIVNDWFVEGIMEIWPDPEVPGLIPEFQKIFQDLKDNNMVGVFTFQRGYNRYHALLAPADYLEEGKISLIAYLVRKKLCDVHQHVIDLAIGVVKVTPLSEFQDFEAPLEPI